MDSIFGTSYFTAYPVTLINKPKPQSIASLFYTHIFSVNSKKAVEGLKPQPANSSKHSTGDGTTLDRLRCLMACVIG